MVEGRETALEMSFDRIGVMRGLGVDVDGVIRVGEAIDFWVYLEKKGKFGERESVVSIGDEWRWKGFVPRVLSSYQDTI